MDEDRDTLVEAHLKLVPPIARAVQRHLPPSFDLDDLIGEGYVGLMHAAERYEPEAHSGTPFSVFARPRIHGAIVDSVRRRAWLENTANPLDDAPEPAHAPAVPFLVNERPRSIRRRPIQRTGGLRPECLPAPLARALRRLPARQRLILGALYADNRSVRDAAQLLHIPVALVISEHAKALEILHAALLRNMSIIGSTLVFVLEERAA